MAAPRKACRRSGSMRKRRQLWRPKPRQVRRADAIQKLRGAKWAKQMTARARRSGAAKLPGTITATSMQTGTRNGRRVTTTTPMTTLSRLRSPRPPTPGILIFPRGSSRSRRAPVRRRKSWPSWCDDASCSGSWQSDPTRRARRPFSSWRTCPASPSSGEGTRRGRRSSSARRQRSGGRSWPSRTSPSRSGPLSRATAASSSSP
mmetsp:Transcript_6225/g.17742  ORF Transcript_6225/g.17742 Transcript_6225/m.17742 type:complete len:204 (+) Transcript_6225:771-1382(+)